jgi:hypothetical protein
MSMRAVQALKRYWFVELCKMLANAETSDHSAVTPREASRGLKDAISLERLLDGLSTENVSVHVTEDPFEGLEPSEVETMLALEMTRRKRLGK